MSNGSGEQWTGGTLPDGFSFLLGELIPTEPYIFPGESYLVELCEIVAMFGGYIPIYGWIISIIAEIIEVILELIDYLVSLFEGKPRSEDTLIVIGRLARGQSPIAQIWAVLLHKALVNLDIVISSSDPNQQKVLQSFTQWVETALIATGSTQAEAQAAISEVWSHTTGPTQALPKILAQPLPQGYTLIGDPALQQAFITHYNNLIQPGQMIPANPMQPAKAARLTWTWLMNTSKYTLLLTIQGRPSPTQPPGMPPQPPTPPVTQPGSGQKPQPSIPSWQVLASCFPGQPGIDPTTDEIGGLGAQFAWGATVIAVAILNVYQAIQNQSTAGQTDPVTCTQLTGLMGALTTATQSIAAALTALALGTTGPTPDLTAITAALESSATSLGIIAAELAPTPGVPISPPPTTSSFRVFLASILPAWVADGTMDAADVQPLL